MRLVNKLKPAPESESISVPADLAGEDMLQVRKIFARGEHNNALEAASTLACDEDQPFDDRLEALDLMGSLYGENGMTEDQVKALKDKATLFETVERYDDASEVYEKIADVWFRSDIKGAAFNGARALESATSRLANQSAKVRATNAEEDGPLLEPKAKAELEAISAKKTELKEKFARRLGALSHRELKKFPKDLVTSERQHRAVERRHQYKSIAKFAGITTCAVTCVGAISSFATYVHLRTYDLEVPKSGEYLGNADHFLGKGKMWVFEGSEESDASRVDCDTLPKLVHVGTTGGIYVLCDSARPGNTKVTYKD